MNRGRSDEGVEEHSRGEEEEERKKNPEFRTLGYELLRRDEAFPGLNPRASDGINHRNMRQQNDPVELAKVAARGGILVTPRTSAGDRTPKKHEDRAH